MMMWFNGPVQSAVDKVKSSSSLFLVFVRGDDDLSKRYETFLGRDVKLKAEDFVPIKILHNSVAHEQFKKIYVTVPVPSVFLIGTDGIPLAIVSSQDPSNLNDALNKALAKHKKQNGTFIANDVAHIETIPLSKDEAGTFQKVNSSDKEDNIARIQFRLPSNEIRSWEFPNMCTLHDVKLYLMETVKLGPEFKLLRTFPRTAFTPQDEDRTLTDLSLTPNATLIVVPVQDEAIQSKIRKMITRQNFIFTFISIVFQPVFTIFSYIGKFFQRAPEQKKVNLIGRNSSESRQKRFSKKTSTSNIHGFTFDESDTDSDMNTDNGNSTQQK